MAFGFKKVSNAVQAEIDQETQKNLTEADKVTQRAEERIRAIEAGLKIALENLKDKTEKFAQEKATADIQRQQDELAAYRTALANFKADLKTTEKGIRQETQQARAERIASFQVAGLKRYPGIFSRAGELFTSFKTAVAGYRKDSGFLATYQAATIEQASRDNKASKDRSVEAIRNIADKLPDTGDEVATAVLKAIVTETAIAQGEKRIVKQYANQLKDKVADTKAEIGEEQAKVGAEFRSNLGDVTNAAGAALAGTGSNIVDAVVVAPATTVARIAKTAADVVSITNQGGAKITKAREDASATRPVKPGREPKAQDLNAA